MNLFRKKGNIDEEDKIIWKTIRRESFRLGLFATDDKLGGQISGFIAFSTCIAPSFIGMCFYLYMIQKEHAVVEKLICLVAILELATYMSGAVSVGLNSRGLIKFMEKASFHGDEEIETLRNAEKRHEFLSKFLYWLVMFCCCATLIQRYYINANCSKAQIDDPHYICGALVPLRYPFEIDVFPYRQIIFVLNTAVVTIYCAPGAFFLIMVLGGPELIALRLEHLGKQLRKIDFSVDTANIQLEKFRRCVQFYQQVKDLNDTFNNSMGNCFAFQYTLVSLVLGVQEYILVVKFDWYYLLSLISYIITEAAICFSGQYLKNESQALLETLNNIKWYDMTPELRKTYQLFLIEVQQTMVLMANPIIILDCEFFLQVLKASYSAALLFQQFAD